MTSYSGGKQKIGKRIAEKIYNESIKISHNEKFKIEGYAEPFSGMLGVFQHIPELFEHYNLKYKANDINASVIEMWKSLQNGWVPPTNISESEYNKLKYDGSNSAIKGYAGHQYSFSGKYFKGFAPKYGKTFDSKKLIDKLILIANKLKDVKFSSGDYKKFSNLKNYIIYLDPPYINSECHYIEPFDHKEFYNWCDKMSEHNILFLSEYHAPKQFTKILSITNKLTGVSPSIKNKKRKRSKIRTENLYML